MPNIKVNVGDVYTNSEKMSQIAQTLKNDAIKVITNANNIVNGGWTGENSKEYLRVFQEFYPKISGKSDAIKSVSNGLKQTGDIIAAFQEAAKNAIKTLEEGAGKIQFQIQNGIDLTRYTDKLHTKKKASSDVVETAGVVTTNNRTYSVVPDSEYTKQPGTISQSDYELLIAQVAGESANDQSDMLGVTSTVLNRLETDGMGDSVHEVLQKGYFPWGETYRNYVEGGKYYNTDWGQAKLEQVKNVVDDALNGARNIKSNVYYYAGDGKHNYFSDVV